MKRILIFFLALLTLAFAFFSLSVIGKQTSDFDTPASVGTAAPVSVDVTPAPTPTPAPQPTSTPVPSVVLGGNTVTQTDTSVDLSTATAADLPQALYFLPTMPNLQTVNIGTNLAALGAANIAQLRSVTPAVFTGSATVYGKPVALDAEALDFRGSQISDGGAELRSVLPAMSRLTSVNLDGCGLSNDALGQLQQEYPAVTFIWRIYFGSNNNYSCLTSNETILASKPSVYGSLTVDNTRDLKYCTRVKNLDLGHNSKLTEVPFVAFMPDLEICILTCTAVNSLEPFRDHTKLVLLEIGDAQITDLSPLSTCPNLKFLNVGLNKGLTTFAPLHGLTSLKKISLGGTGAALDTVDALQAALPNTEIIKDLVYIDASNSYTSTEGMWRYDNMVASEEAWKHAQETGIGTFVNSENYTMTREAFNYDAGSAAYCTEANGF